MSETLHTLELRGCAPVPLAHYLKGLGILRLVSEQVDPTAQGWWKNDVFFLRSKLDRNGLMQFFLNDYSPTPLVGPWGARSGFFAASSENAARQALTQIETTETARLNRFRRGIRNARDVLKALGLTEKADNDEDKLRLLCMCRAKFDDDLLEWLDTVYVLLSEGRAFPPLLGTGGNEGSGSYMSGFAQEVAAVLVERKWDHALCPAIFGENQPGNFDDQTPGHFDPNAAGRYNATIGFEGTAKTNPWDYLLTLEGTLLFASSAVKRLEDRSAGTLASPFCVKSTGAGYGSADISDEETANAEMWFPIWNSPTSLPELRLLLNEGRATVDKQRARTGLDFARAVATLGVDRGISHFERYGFLQRNGKNSFAVHLGRFHSFDRVNGPSTLLAPLDTWLDHFRRVATRKNTPARARRALRQLESTFFELCQQGRPEDVQALLLALGEAEATVAISKDLREGEMGNGISPIPLLSPKWLVDSNGADLLEFRLAAALAGIWHETVGPFRRHLEPFDFDSPFPKWLKSADDPAIVWNGGNLIRNLHAVLQRRLIQVLQEGKESGGIELLMPLKASFSVSLDDIQQFISHRVDDDLIDSFLRTLILVNWKPKEAADRESLRKFQDQCDQHSSHRCQPDAAYALLKLCHLSEVIDGKPVKLDAQILRRAISGNGSAATRLASRRLNASGFRPAIHVVPLQAERCRRVAAALAFPISRTSALHLRHMILRPEENPGRENRQENSSVATPVAE